MCKIYKTPNINSILNTYYAELKIRKLIGVIHQSDGQEGGFNFGYSIMFTW